MFDKILSMLPVLNIPDFWIAQDSEYVFGSEYATVLDIPGSQYAPGFKYSWTMRHQVILHNKSCLNKYLSIENQVQE